jgi:DNA transformation protein
MAAFRPYGEEGEVMQYYEVPAEVLEEPEELGAWAQAAIEVARRAKGGRSRRRRG